MLSCGIRSKPCIDQLSGIKTEQNIQMIRSKSNDSFTRTVYTFGEFSDPHGDGPNERMPAKYTYALNRFDRSTAIKGPPVSPASKIIRLELVFRIYKDMCCERTSTSFVAHLTDT